MKILLVHKFHFLQGGAEKHFFDLKKLLEYKGHQVVVFAMQHEKNLPSAQAKYFVSKVDFEKVRFNQAGLRTARRMLFSWEAKRKLEQLIKDERPDIAHLHNIYHQLSPSILLALKKYSVPVCLTLHDFKLICPNYLLYTEGRVCEGCRGGRYWQCVKHRCLKHSLAASMLASLEMYLHKALKLFEKNVDVFLSPSQFLIQKIRDWRIPLKDIRHLPNFIEVKPETQASAGNYLLYLGRLSAEKGLLTLLDAIKGVDYPLHLVGTGQLEPVLRNTAARENLSQVQFLGYQSGERLRQIIDRAVALILPSETYENFPTAVLEAYAQAKPVIGSNHGGIAELVKDGETGLLFQPGSAGDLRQKIIQLISDPARAQKLGQNGYQLVKKYNSETYYHKLISIYEELLAKK